MFEKFCATVLLCVISAIATAGSEAIPGTTFSVDFGGSSLSGAGRIIRGTNIPVQAGNTTVYYNVDMEFGILPDGSFGSRLISASAANGPVSPTSVSTMNFQAGAYTGIDPYAAANALPCSFALDNPSIGADGRRTYVLNVTSTASGCPSNRKSYTWQTGPAAGNGVVGNVGQAFVAGASLTYAYGMDSAGYVIRVLQNGNTITIQQAAYDASPTGRILTVTK